MHKLFTCVANTIICIFTNKNDNAHCLQTASIIFLDLPVGTGFSYSRTSVASSSTDSQACDQAVQFLRKVSSLFMKYTVKDAIHCEVHTSYIVFILKIFTVVSWS